MSPAFLFAVGLLIGFALGIIFMAVLTGGRNGGPPPRPPAYTPPPVREDQRETRLSGDDPYWKCGLYRDEHPVVGKAGPYEIRRCIPPPPPPPPPPERDTTISVKDAGRETRRRGW